MTKARLLKTDAGRMVVKMLLGTLPRYAGEPRDVQVDIVEIRRVLKALSCEIVCGK